MRNSTLHIGAVLPDVLQALLVEGLSKKVERESKEASARMFPDGASFADTARAVNFDGDDPRYR